MHIRCIRHEADPDDDRVIAWCKARGWDADLRRPYAGDTSNPITEETRGVVVYGGMYNAYDEDKHPFLRDEYRIIEDALKTDTPLIGICQGAQMIARALGAWVGAPEHGNHEFGYYEVSPTEAGRSFMPEPLHLVQFHFHTFDIPDGAVHLARSELFENQAFSYGQNCLALQFHAEVTQTGFQRWMQKTDAYGKPGMQTAEVQAHLMRQHDPLQHRWFMSLLDQVFGASQQADHAA